MPTAEGVRRLLDYDADTGVLTWRVDPRHGPKRAGTVAGCVFDNGYRYIGINGRYYGAHRIAWLWVHGKWPAECVDHVSGERDDNRIVNLREATRTENQHNRKNQEGAASAYLGVTWSSARKKWRAAIRASGTRIYLGEFECERAAFERYCEAKRELHPFCAVPRDLVAEGA